MLYFFLISAVVLAILRCLSAYFPDGTAMQFFADKLVLFAYLASGLLLVVAALSGKGLSNDQSSVMMKIAVFWFIGLVIVWGVPAIFRRM
ncbi:hypothetical protein BOO69_11200 [Sulfitobacter alexandrii]|uniref:Uncharacterized protein n=1 Tax=Sulfitobacter alexandrii TaxID=1917485 RepID=A0A1J0WHV6_9RHOB|nr:hypothetical protein [Sulfitobacter alexandrii]APE43911.1 hypothetical protein BOO69_11200 [Sulfitobacter alexandrii]